MAQADFIREIAKSANVGDGAEREAHQRAKQEYRFSTSCTNAIMATGSGPPRRSTNVGAATAEAATTGTLPTI